MRLSSLSKRLWIPLLPALSLLLWFLFPLLDEKWQEIRIARFLGVPFYQVSLECNSGRNHIRWGETEGKEELSFCLFRDSPAPRCEVAIHALEQAPARLRLAYQVKYKEAAEANPHWLSLMQIHDVPDEGEHWRCPMLAVEIVDKSLRSFSRWDSSPISVTNGDHCTEAGSTIESSLLLPPTPFPPKQWHDMAFEMVLSHTPAGQMTIHVNDDVRKTRQGGNIYHDKTMPYLKIGVYKTPRWAEPHDYACATYRSFHLDKH